MPERIKKFTVNINKTAKNDLREIIKFISKNNPMNGLNTLDHFPERGGYVPELVTIQSQKK